MVFDPAQTDTIAAISTPLGVAGIGIVRLSGPAARPISERIFRPNKPIPSLMSHRLYLGRIVDPETGETLDEVLLSFMAAPASYTREDVVEINAHSGYLILARILETVLKEGARLAEPGEFTFRAFLRGRIDLSQAEAVMDLIHAQSERGVRLAANHLKGSLRSEVEKLRNQALDILARIEVMIDYPEEGLQVLPTAEEMQRELLHPLQELIAAHDPGKIWIQGLDTVIVGRVNVGKSSLLNRLLKEERAMVSAIPGTTRDVIESTVYVQGLPLRLMDTAGFRHGKGILENKGMEQAMRKMEEAEMILLILDQSRPLNRVDLDLLDRARRRKALAVLNKIDLPSRMGRRNLERVTAGLPLVRISALTGEGVDGLRQAILRVALSGDEGGRDLSLAPNVRQKQALEKASAAFARASQTLQAAMPLEVPAQDMKEGLDALGETSGETSSEDILSRVFSRFCLGK